MGDSNFDEDLLFDGVSQFSKTEDSVPKENAPAKRIRKQPNRKVIDSWSDEDIIKLIGGVELKICLWDARSDEYKNKTSRENAWREVAKIFDNKTAVQQLAAKWQLLRNQFRASSPSAKNTKSGKGVEKKPQWKFYSYMKFIAAAEREQNVHSESNLDAVSINILLYECINVEFILNNLVYIYIAVERFTGCINGLIHRRLDNAKFIQRNSDPQTKADCR